MKTKNKRNSNCAMDSNSQNNYNVCEVDDLELEKLEKKKKEILVKRVHKNEITQPTEKYNLYRTRVNGAPNGRIAAKTYDELIDKLYEYYYSNNVEIPTFEEAVNQWISTREANGTIEYLTAVHYRADFKKYLADLPIAKMKMTEITKNHLINTLESIIGDGSDISKKAVSNTRTIINGAFDYVNRIDGINCFDPRIVKIRDLTSKCQDAKSQNETYIREEAETLISHLATKPHSVYTLGIMLMFCLSVRISELRALKWVDYDKENKVLHFNHTIVTKCEGHTHRKAVDVNYMKRHSEAGKRDIEVSDFAEYLLDELHKITGEKEYILQSRGNMPISTNNFNDHLKKYCEECGITYMSSHKIRFYVCSRMYELGIDERTIQTEMGHASLGMTRHYDRRKKKPIERNIINSAFGFDIPGDGNLKSLKP